MIASPQPPLPSDVPVDRGVVRLFFGTGAVACLVSALLYGLAPLGLAPLRRGALVAVCLAGAAVYGYAARLILRAGLARASQFAGWATIAVVMAVAVGLGEGTRAPALGFVALIVCVAGITVGLRTALAMAAASAAGVCALALGDAWLALPGGAAERGTPAVAAATVCLLLGASVATAALIARITAHYGMATAEREVRFRQLLGLAADAYWELDAQLRFTQTSAIRDGPLAQEETTGWIGRAPWEIDALHCDPDTLDSHRADLEARQPFRGLLVFRRDAPQRSRALRVSGEPRFDHRGVFTGYWGVVRDVTAELTARQALLAGETRYRELFRRVPSPLIVHRGGLVSDANPAAVSLFGYPDLAAFLGQDLLRHSDSEAGRALTRQRIAEIEQAAVGAVLPARELAVISLQGQRLELLVSSVRVEMADGPATLVILYDETERREADAALRRSEALLSHLVATTPDLISLSESASGRYLMVNPSFSRITGWPAEEIVGRPASEIGLWHDPADRERLLDAVRARGSVDAMPLRFRARSGAVLSMLVSAARFQLEGFDHLVINARDVSASERTRLELETILRQASIGIAFTRDAVFVQTNAHFERMFGWPAGGLIGQAGSVVWPGADDYAEVAATAGPLLAAGRSYDTERPMRRRNGSAFWCRLRAHAIDPERPAQGGTVWIAEDVTERRSIEQALATARDAAEAADRAKSAFLANISHEIRTPLNGLLGLAPLAMRRGLDAPRREQYLREIEASAQKLAAILSDMLDLSKIEAGKLVLESLDFDLHALLGEMRHVHQPLAEARGLRFVLAIGEGVPQRVRGDPLRTRQILAAYLGNALKFTERGEVRLEARAGVRASEQIDTAPWLRFTVSDTGPGIEPATLARLFKPFTQADESTTRRHGGTGMGLAVCHELAGLMGGRVGATSEVGGGSHFWAELPLPPAATVAAVGDDLAGLRVLLVEDNPVNMMIAAATLELWGVHVTQADDGPAAIDAADRAAALGEPLDVVLMDLQMPLMSGYETAHALRQRHDAARLPIIALTAAPLLSEREAALAAGMSDFLTKPLDPERLRQALRRVRAAQRGSGA